MADLVCVMDCSGDVSGVSIMAVSPTLTEPDVEI